MRLVVCSVMVPFVRGGAEAHVESLVDELTTRGHRVARIDLPFQWIPHEELIKQAAVWRSIALPVEGPDAVDGVICTKFPTYLVRHPRKITWLLHQHR
ncbi:glycosyltransferase family 1 protein, partial [bacterium]|nr:glycosyltransferase family 1 protein [candidate division CSSED10-310 bacterium]